MRRSFLSMAGDSAFAAAPRRAPPSSLPRHEEISLTGPCEPAGAALLSEAGGAAARSERFASVGPRRDHDQDCERGSRGEDFRFPHGLGDVVCLAFQVPLYVRRGYRVCARCDADKSFLLEAAGAQIVSRAARRHRWGYPPIPQAAPTNWLPLNKLWHNVGAAPLPGIERTNAVWQEYLDVDVSLAAYVTPAARRAVDCFIDWLPRPIMLLHLRGLPSRCPRGLGEKTAHALISTLVASSPGTVLVLDWSATRTTPLAFPAHARVRSLGADWKDLNLREFYYLLTKSAVFIGCDSGPAHFVRFSAVPAVTCWTTQWSAFGCPAFCALPRRKTVNVMPITAGWRAELGAAEYRIAVCPTGREALDGRFIADQAFRVCAEP